MKPIDKSKLVKKPSANSANGGRPIVNTPNKPSFKENNVKNQVFGAPKHFKNKKKNKKKDGMPVPIKIGAGVAATSIAVGVVGYALTNNHGANQNSQSPKSNDQGDGFDKSNDSDNDGLTKHNKKNNSKKNFKKNSKKKDGKETDLLNDLLTESDSSKHGSKGSNETSSDELGSLIKSMSKEDSSDSGKGGLSLKQLAKKADQSKENAEVLGTSKDKGMNTSKAEKNKESSSDELQQLANKNKVAAKENNTSTRIPGQPNGTGKGENVNTSHEGQPTKTPDHGGTTGGNSGQPTKAPDHGRTTGGNSGQPTKAPDHGGTTGGNNGQPTKTPDHGGATGGNSGQPTKTPDHGGTTGGNNGQPTKTPDHGGATGGNSGQPTKTPDHGGATGGNSGQPTTPDHGGTTGGDNGQPTTPNHGGTTGGDNGQPTKTPDHGGTTGGDSGQPTKTPDHGGTTGGNSGQPTKTPDHGGATGGNSGQPTTPDHGGTTGGDNGQPTKTPDHGGTTGGDNGQPTKTPDHGGATGGNSGQPTTPDHGGTTGGDNGQPTTPNQGGDENKSTPVITTIHAEINSDGTVVLGTTDPNVTINIVDESNGGTLGTTLSNELGQFSVTLHQPATNGQKLNVIATKDGYKSLSTDFIAPKISSNPITPEPSLPDSISFKCYTSDGTYVGDGNAVKQSDGSYEVHTPNGYVPENNQEVLNNTGRITVIPSQQEQATFLNNVGFNANGNTISGITNPNTTVTFFSNGVSLGSTKSDGAGNFSFNLPNALTHGEIVKVAANDISVNATAPSNPYAGLPDGSRQDVQFVTSDGQVVGNGYLVKENSGVTLHDIPIGYKLFDEDANGHSPQLLNWPKIISVIPTSSVSNV